MSMPNLLFQTISKTTLVIDVDVALIYMCLFCVISTSTQEISFFKKKNKKVIISSLFSSRNEKETKLNQNQPKL